MTQMEAQSYSASMKLGLNMPTRSHLEKHSTADNIALDYIMSHQVGTQEHDHRKQKTHSKKVLHKKPLLNCD